MENAKLEIRVGLFTMGAFLLLVWGWSWLKSFSPFHQPQRFIARFDDVAGMTNNATVNVQGVRVGTVEALLFTPDKKIDAHIKITEGDLDVPQGSDFSIQTLGMVGAKYIEITLPRDATGKPIPAPPLTANDVVAPLGEGDPKMGIVHNPIRVELIVNNMAHKIEKIVGHIDSESAGKALNNLSEASAKLNNNMDRLKDVAESVKTASSSIATTSREFQKTASSATTTSDRASTFFKDGDTTLKNITSLTADMRGTNSHINKLLSNPNFSSDLKETITQARQTAETIKSALADLQTTLKDKELRTEVLASLTKLQQSTDNIKSSMETANKISSDQGLRSDLKDIVKQAREAMNQASALLNDPTFKQDIGQTLTKLRSAATNVDVASKQVQQVLDKRAPLLQMLFGRPGKITPQMLCPTAPVTCPPAPASHATSP